jgi:glycosyltransferase involved in cell wall biosynthesis
VTHPRLRAAITLEQCWHRVPGGTAVAAVEAARALAARPDVEMVGVAARHRGQPPAPWRPSVHVEQLPLPRLALYEAWHRLRKPRVERATGPIDIVHATTIAIPPRSAPLIVTIHDLSWRKEPAHFTSRGLRFFERGLALALGEADLVLCSSQATLADCLDAGFARDRLRHVPLGVRVELASPGSIQRVLESHGLTSPYLLWVGTIEPRKNLANLLRAYRALERDIELVLVGPRGWNEDLDSLIAPFGARIRVLGFVPEAEREALYGGAAVFCFPSLSEGFGFPVLEAMAQGTPVVTSVGTSTEELARDAGVVVDPRDPESIATGIASVLDDAVLAEKLAGAGPARAAEYSWDRTAELIADAYHEVAA